MDPVVAIGLAATCASLVENIIKTASILYGLIERFRTAELAILSLTTQLSTLEASISELKDVLLTNRQAKLNKRGKLLNALQESLDSATRVVSHISDELSRANLAASQGVKLGRWARAKFLFTGPGLARMKETLRDQIQAIQFLLSVLICM